MSKCNFLIFSSIFINYNLDDFIVVVLCLDPCFTMFIDFAGDIIPFLFQRLLGFLM